MTDTLFPNMQLKSRGRRRPLMFQQSVAYNEAVVTFDDRKQLVIKPYAETGWCSLDGCKADVLRSAEKRGTTIKLYGDKYTDMPERYADGLFGDEAKRITREVPNVSAIFVEYWQDGDTSAHQFIIITRQELTDDVDSWKHDAYPTAGR